jgi:hypothetical protein
MRKKVALSWLQEARLWDHGDELISTEARRNYSKRDEF